MDGAGKDVPMKSLEEQKKYNKKKFIEISSESFIKKPEAKFISWYNEQNKLSVDETLYKGIDSLLWSGNIHAIFSLYGDYDLRMPSGLIKDAYLKRLTLCHNVIFNMTNSTKYGIAEIDNIFKMYDDVFYYLMNNYKIYALSLPSVLDDLGSVVKVDSNKQFDSIEDLKSELDKRTENGEVAVYNFYIESLDKIYIRYCPVNIKK